MRTLMASDVTPDAGLKLSAAGMMSFVNAPESRRRLTTARKLPRSALNLPPIGRLEARELEELEAALRA